MINKAFLISCVSFFCAWLSAIECRSASEEKDYMHYARQPLRIGHEGDEENHEGAARQAPSLPPIVHDRDEESAHWALGLCMDGCVESLREIGQLANADGTPTGCYIASLDKSHVRYRENNDPWWPRGIALCGRVFSPVCRGLAVFFPSFTAAYIAKQAPEHIREVSIIGGIAGSITLISSIYCGLYNRAQALPPRSYLITTAIDVASVSLMFAAHGILSQNIEQFACSNDPIIMCETINPSVIEACQGLLITSGILNLYGLGRSLYSGWRR